MLPRTVISFYLHYTQYSIYSCVLRTNFFIIRTSFCAMQSGKARASAFELILVISELLGLESNDDDRLLNKNINTFCLNSPIVYVSLFHILA